MGMHNDFSWTEKKTMIQLFISLIDDPRIFRNCSIGDVKAATLNLLKSMAKTSPRWLYILNLETYQFSNIYYTALVFVDRLLNSPFDRIPKGLQVLFEKKYKDLGEWPKLEVSLEERKDTFYLEVFGEPLITNSQNRSENCSPPY